MRDRRSTAADSSDMRVTCLPALRWAALNSPKLSTKFCMSSMVCIFLLLLVAFWYSPTKSYTSRIALHQFLMRRTTAPSLPSKVNPLQKPKLAGRSNDMTQCAKAHISANIRHYHVKIVR